MMERIAVICGAGYISGKEIMALQLGEGFRDAGVEVCFLTSRWGSGEFPRRAQAGGFSVVRLWLGFISATLRFGPVWMTADQFRRWPALVMQYRRFLREFQPIRIIHTNWHHVLMLWPFLRPERDVYWAHEVMADKPRYRSLFRRLSKRCGAFVGVSRSAADALIRLGVPESKVSVIYNGLADYAADSRRDRRNGCPKIGIVGQIGAWKGHDDLLRAFALVRRTIHDAELHVIGEGDAEYVRHLRRLSGELNVEGAVTWHGFVNQLQRIYPDLSLVVVPSRVAESFGMTAAEAALFGLPVVATRGGGLSEVVEDGRTGFLVESGNPHQLADRIALLLQDSELRKRMGKEARRRALHRFSRKRMVHDFLKVLHSDS